MDFLECFKVKSSEIIKESYEVEDTRITLNISKEKYNDLLYSFIKCLEEPCFFILENPLTLQEEKRLRRNETDSFHCQTYYIDGLTKDIVKSIIDNYLEIFKNDGLISFGFASHYSHDEIMFTKYNVAYIFSRDVQKYLKMLDELKISESNNFVTAWDTFSQKEPGDAFDLNPKEKNVNTFINYATINLGMYKAEIR